MGNERKTGKAGFVGKALSTRNQSGAVLVVIAILLFVLIGIAALAIDIGHLMVVRNQVQNAADAGALAGARVLYSSVSGTEVIVNAGANAVASAVTTTNVSDNFPVEAIPDNIIKGHWCFSCVGPDGEQGVFTPNDSATSFTLNTLDFATLDADTNYINAVKVIASRGPGIRAASFFARIFGYDGFSLNADAVAWVGFCGSHFKADQPLAICQQSMLGPDGKENCTGGKLINSNVETGAWTNLEQNENTCVSASSAPEVRPLICTGGEIPKPLTGGQPITLVNGELQSVFGDFYDCWRNNSSLDTNGDHMPDQVWKLLLPMIDCSDSNPICKPLIGAIQVEIFWITPNGNDPHFNRIPTAFDVVPGPDSQGMEYTCPPTCSQAPCPSMSTEEGRKLCWLDFLSKFNVTDGNGKPYTLDNTGYTPNTVYFKPSCEFKNVGRSGGATSNVIADIPMLVK